MSQKPNLTIGNLELGQGLVLAPMAGITDLSFRRIVKSFGVDLVHFGVLMNLNISIGQASPPIGSTLFIGCTISKMDIARMFRPSIPFLAAGWIVLMLVTYIPLIWHTISSMVPAGGAT